MTRELGFYWVKVEGKWVIGEFGSDSWYFTDPMLDRPGGWYDEDLDEIDEVKLNHRSSK